MEARENVGRMSSQFVSSKHIYLRQNVLICKGCVGTLQTQYFQQILCNRNHLPLTISKKVLLTSKKDKSGISFCIFKRHKTNQMNMNLKSES